MWEIDWNKIETIENLKDILKTINPIFKGELNDFPDVKEFLVFKYPKEKNGR